MYISCVSKLCRRRDIAVNFGVPEIPNRNFAARGMFASSSYPRIGGILLRRALYTHGVNTRESFGSIFVTITDGMLAACLRGSANRDSARISVVVKITQVRARHV